MIYKYIDIIALILLLILAIIVPSNWEKDTMMEESYAYPIKYESNNESLLKLGKEVAYDGLTRDELVDKLNKNLYDTLANTGSYFADYAIKTGLDPYLAVAIVNLETGCKWGCSSLTKENYNIGGLGGSGNYMSFNSLEEGINAFLDILYNNYWLNGLTTPELMNSKYAASSSWALKVNNYYSTIKES